MSPPHPIPYQGSKRRLAPRILSYFPARVRTLYEPFAGSAALTLAAAAAERAESYRLSDSLEPLMRLWSEIVAGPDALAERYEALWARHESGAREAYEWARDEYNAEPRPAHLLYLLARCVKAAVRFNRAGEFNQSADRRRLGTHPERMAGRLQAAHALLAGRAHAGAADYVDATRDAGPDDLVYLDPPYQGTSRGRDERYAETLDFDRFVTYLGELRDRGVPFVVSFDGRTGRKRHGQPLPATLGLRHVELDAGRSSQATLLGRADRTIESLYLSPDLSALDI